MTASTRAALVFAVCLVAAPAVIHAHFKLVEPASWILEDDRGDPAAGDGQAGLGGARHPELDLCFRHLGFRRRCEP
jgi:hypothetical protein